MTNLPSPGRSGETRPALKSMASLLAFLAAWLAVAYVLWTVSGPPSLPSVDLGRIRQALSSSEVSSSDAIGVASLLGWAAFLYVAVTTAFRIFVGLAWRLTDGASWATAGLRLSAFATLPPVRRVVDGAIIGSIVLGLWMRDRTETEAALMVPTPALVAYLPADSSSNADRPPLVFSDPDSRKAGTSAARYTLRDGEGLWHVAQRLYGDGSRYAEIFAANQGHLMANGERLADPNVVQAGSTLLLPLSTPNLWIEEEQVHYRVQSGDSLWRISATFLGSGFKWVEIWDLNQGRTMGDGRVFTNPNLIHPGWILILPLDSHVDATESSFEPTEPAVEEDDQPAPALTPSAVPPTATPPPASTWTPEAELPGSLTEPSEPQGEGHGIALPSVPWPGHLPVLATAAGLAGLASTYLLVRRTRRWLDRPRAPAGQADRRGQPQGNAGQVVLAVRSLMAAIADAGFTDSRALLVREAAKYQDCYIECPPGDADALEGQRFDLARRLACGVDIEVLSQVQVRVRLSRFNRLAGLLLDEGVVSSTLLVPVGGEDGSLYYLNLAAAGTTLVSGAEEETSQLVGGWIETLASTCRANELSLIVSEAVRSNGASDDSILHVSEGTSPEAVVDEVEDILLAREARNDGQPPFVVGITAGDQIPTSRIETLRRHGRRQNVALVLVGGPMSELVDSDTIGAAIAFNHPEVALSLSGWDGEGDLVLLTSALPPLGLYAVDVLRRTVPSVGYSATADAPAANETDWWTASEAEAEAWPSAPDSVQQHGGAEGVRLEEGTEDNVVSPEEMTGYDEEIFQAEESEDELDSTATAESEEEVAVPVVNDTPGKQLNLAMGNGSALHEGDDESVAASPVVTVQAFGRFEVSFKGETLNQWRITKSRELLAFLLCQHAPVDRLAIMENLWPDAMPSQAEHMLRNAVYYLRAALREAVGDASRSVEFVKTEHRSCQVQTRLFQFDAGSFMAHLARAEGLTGHDALIEYERGLSLYKGDLLAGERFEWVDVYREEYRKRYVQAAKQAGLVALETRDTGRAITFYQLALSQDAIDEESARGLMQAYAGRADVNGVKKTYRILCEALRQELEDDEARPLPNTEALFQELTRRVGATD